MIELSTVIARAAKYLSLAVEQEHMLSRWRLKALKSLESISQTTL